MSNNEIQANARLKGKVAVVTGASKGIGAAIARSLAREGASVVVNYASSEVDALNVVRDIEATGGKAIAVKANVGSPEDIARLFAAADGAFGRLDILVNNAGVYAFTPIEAITAENVDGMFDVNVRGLLLCTKEAAARFPSQGGNIVNVGSVVGEMAPAAASVYAATKASVNAITRVLAKELGPRQVRVNAVNPGPIVTEGFKSAGFAGDIEASMVANTPLGRVGQPGDVADVVAFLVSDEARWITGTLLDTAGGWR
jgi:3-oxoacyl-[acyl-carrier protein] reductase